MPLWLQVAAGILGVAAGVIGFGVAVGYVSSFMVRAQVLQETKKLEKRMDSIEESLRSSVAPFIELLIAKPPNPLSPEENERKNGMLKSLEFGRLAPDAARELQILLQTELQEAKKKEDTAVVVAIVAVLLLLAFVLSRE